MTKKSLQVFASLLLMGCGPEEPSGPDAPPEASPQRTVWKDAKGVIVAWDGLTYTDARGLHWTLSPETARPTDYPHSVVPAIAYTSPGCVGPAYLGGPAPMPFPRVPFKVPGETTYRLRPDGVAAQPLTYQSARLYGGACGALSGTSVGFPLDSAPPANPPVQEPAWTFVPPLHMERG